MASLLSALLDEQHLRPKGETLQTSLRSPGAGGGVRFAASPHKIFSPYPVCERARPYSL